MGLTEKNTGADELVVEEQQGSTGVVARGEETGGAAEAARRGFTKAKPAKTRVSEAS